MKDILDRDQRIAELKNTNVKLQKKLEKEHHTKNTKDKKKSTEGMKHELLELETK